MIVNKNEIRLILLGVIEDYEQYKDFHKRCVSWPFEELSEEQFNELKASIRKDDILKKLK